MGTPSIHMFPVSRNCKLREKGNLSLLAKGQAVGQAPIIMMDVLQWPASLGGVSLLFSCLDLPALLTYQPRYYPCAYSLSATVTPETQRSIV